MNMMTKILRRAAALALLAGVAIPAALPAAAQQQAAPGVPQPTYGWSSSFPRARRGCRKALADRSRALTVRSSTGSSARNAAWSGATGS